MGLCLALFQPGQDHRSKFCPIVSSCPSERAVISARSAERRRPEREHFYSEAHSYPVRPRRGGQTVQVSAAKRGQGLCHSLYSVGRCPISRNYSDFDQATFCAVDCPLNPQIAIGISSGLLEKFRKFSLRSYFSLIPFPKGPGLFQHSTLNLGQLVSQILDEGFDWQSILFHGVVV
jgi:hypothetical protein